MVTSWSTWDDPAGTQDMGAREAQSAALRLIDRLEDLGLLGQVAIDTTEEAKK